MYNTTGSTVTELYLYDAGSEEKGDNLAGENGLADGENLVITRDVEADKQSDVTYVLESPPRTARPRALRPCTTRSLPSPC